MSGLACHFKLSTFPLDKTCGNVSLFGWLFVLVFTAFLLSAVMFIIITQSAVYTVATMSASIPLVGVWWSLFRMLPFQSGKFVLKLLKIALLI